MSTDTITNQARRLRAKFLRLESMVGALPSHAERLEDARSTTNDTLRQLRTAYEDAMTAVALHPHIATQLPHVTYDSAAAEAFQEV